MRFRPTPASLARARLIQSGVFGRTSVPGGRGQEKRRAKNIARTQGACGSIISFAQGKLGNCKLVAVKYSIWTVRHQRRGRGVGL